MELPRAAYRYKSSDRQWEAVHAAHVAYTARITHTAHAFRSVCRCVYRMCRIARRNTAKYQWKMHLVKRKKRRKSVRGKKRKKRRNKKERDKRLRRSLKNYSRLRIEGNSFVIASGLSRSIYVEFPVRLSRGKSVSFVRLNEIRGDRGW